MAAVAILLAAGESRRMGQPKALLPWQGTSLLKHQIAALRTAAVERVVVVLGHQPENLLPELQGLDGVGWVVNQDYLHGKTTSIKAGLRVFGADEPDPLLILNVDQPRSAETIRSVLQEHRARKGLITIPTYLGKGGHPLILDRSLVAELLDIDEKTLGMKAVTQQHRESICRVEMDIPEVLWDLNTPEEYQAALKAESSV